jgi:hypothetical protein
VRLVGEPICGDRLPACAHACRSLRMASTSACVLPWARGQRASCSRLFGKAPSGCALPAAALCGYVRGCTD